MKEFEFFKEISKIPRPSGSEGKIADYLCDFAQKRGLFCLRDKFNNVFIRRPASPDKRDREPVLLQAHTDMVCEAAPGIEHDFTKDGLDLKTENGRVYAEGTTLGGDDGAGVAVMLDILADKKLNVGEIECLFTASEETGMEGVFGFDFSVVHSRRVINLDSEEEGCACIGCAGGRRVNVSVPVERIRIDGGNSGSSCSSCSSGNNARLFRLTVSGLAGGHSGTDIHLGRESAVKILGQLLDRIYARYPFNIISLNGGGRDNVIPFSAEAVVVFYDDADVKNAKNEVTSFRKEIYGILCDDDRRAFALDIKRVNTSSSETSDTSNAPGTPGTSVKSGPYEMLTLKSTSAVISALLLSPQGVTSRIPGGDIVLASVNLGSVELDSSLKLGYLIRSDNALRGEMTARVLGRLARVLGGSAETESSYPGWDFRRGTPLQEAYVRACEKVFSSPGVDADTSGESAGLGTVAGAGAGKLKPEFTVIHAGLECGVISARLRELGCGSGLEPDIISIGPDVTGIHTPKESMDIDSLARMGEIVRYMIT